ncbi:TaqI-like C-terminal specificity domain-containing protein [Thermohalobacter berrensis]|uniref:site-specific DNA-methyltransferase (adenine-specific) n=1 Tax=Thermohalobacter berrensis TaxID=99594 RepID=A0A419T4H4_9FIRM|nr:TaqI-like C-terminal specificity domain-containing protein [Thermohalobacter berrensis]RKD32440.1 hypothetical protein BET03_11020 [Thermohalobacter berrensis]
MQKYYYNNLNYVFDIDSSETTFKLRERLFNNKYKSNKYKRLDDVCEVVAGIATGNVRKKLLTFDKNVKNSKKVLRGKDVKKYYHSWSGLYVIDDKSIIDRQKGEYATFMRRKFIYNEKLLIRQTADRFICSYDNEEYYLLNTLYSLIIRENYKKDVHLKYILALLNSKFYNFLYRSIAREEGKIFPQIKIFHIQNSPIVIPSKKTQKQFVKMVNEIIDKKNKIHKTFSDKIRYRQQIDVERLYNSIDKLVYDLFNLLPKEIKEIEREMGKSPIDYDSNNEVSCEEISKKLNKYKDIIRVSEIYKINPIDIYKNVFN